MANCWTEYMHIGESDGTVRWESRGINGGGDNYAETKLIMGSNTERKGEEKARKCPSTYY